MASNSASTPGNSGQKKATFRWLFKSTTLISDITSLQKRLLLELLEPKRQLLELQVLLELQKQLLQEQQLLEQPREQRLLLFYHKQREQQQR
jgi:hypothetical protein